MRKEREREREYSFISFDKLYPILLINSKLKSISDGMGDRVVYMFIVPVQHLFNGNHETIEYHIFLLLIFVKELYILYYIFSFNLRYICLYPYLQCVYINMNI